MQKNSLLQSVTFAIIFLLIVLICIIIFIVKSRIDRQKIQKQNLITNQLLTQKTILLKETHHRIKNNLQLVSGLIYLQSRKYKNPEVGLILKDFQHQINSIALVHEMLYKENTMSSVSMEKYTNDLGKNLLSLSRNNNVNLNIQIKQISLPVRYATTLGLIINELITNSIKHAFESKKGNISVSMKKMNDDKYLFIYKDDGMGIDTEKTKNTNKTLGSKLIKMFAEEIDATLKAENNNGLQHTLTFNIKKDEKSN